MHAIDKAVLIEPRTRYHCDMDKENESNGISTLTLLKTMLILGVLGVALWAVAEFFLA